MSLVILDCTDVANRIRQLCASSLCEDMCIEYEHAIDSVIARLSFDKDEVFPDEFDAYGVTQHRILNELKRMTKPYLRITPNLIYCELVLSRREGNTAFYEITHLDLP